MPSQVHSKCFRSKQGISFRIDFMLEKPDSDTVFYAGIYVTSDHKLLPPNAQVRAVLSSLEPSGRTELPITLRLHSIVRSEITFAAPISGVIKIAYPAQIAIQVDDEWQDDVWQPAEKSHDFNFDWKVEITHEL